MKKLLKLSLTIIAITVLIYSTAYAKASTMNTMNTRYTEPNTNAINTQMLKSQISLFQDALDKLGPTSPLEAATLWAEGEKTRNGVFQYATASKALKNKLSSKLGKADNNLWVIGVSSPWVKKYEFVKNTKVSNMQSVITIKYYWISSKGPETTTTTTLTILKQNNNWYVTKVL
jgi:hypothetical protein